MKKLVLLLTLLMTAAFVAPVTAQALPRPLTLRVEPPIVFSAPTPECPSGAVDYRLRLKTYKGFGRNCLQDFVVVACPPSLPVGFGIRGCQEARVLFTLRLPGGTIEGEATIHEIVRCGDPPCRIDANEQSWSGRVTRATRAFRTLAGASISGGGLIVFQFPLNQFIHVDVTLVID
jgi:hypothetical protein